MLIFVAVCVNTKEKAGLWSEGSAEQSRESPLDPIH